MAETRPDGFDFASDGTILCSIDGEKRKLRRPKTGEFKRLRLAVRERDDELNKLRDEALEETSSITERKGEGEPSKEEAAQFVAIAREAARTISDRQEELDRLWFADVFATLGDEPMPDDLDDWPVWLWQPDNVGKFLDHWRNVPLAHGGK